jgi:hypothetical protein
MDTFSRNFRKELREAERELARNKRLIESTNRGTPSEQTTTWSRKRKKHKGPSS